MKTHRWMFRIAVVVVLALVATMLMASSASAHCDGMDGPVVKAAQQALSTGNVNLALVWVKKEDEGQIRAAFERTLAVRKLGGEARDLADMYFFETLVRIHRAGEGAPYTGLKPAGQDLGPAIPLADRVLANGDIDALVSLISHESRTGLAKMFERARKARNYSPNDIEAGRDYIREYVAFIHYVERMYEAAARSVEGHY